MPQRRRGIAVRQLGNATLVIASITTSGDFSQTNNCGASLAPTKTCKISVTFAPTVGGSQTGTLQVSDNAAVSPQTVNLTGTGTNAVTVSPTSLSFGKVTTGTTSAPMTVTVANNQSVALTTLSLGVPSNFATAAGTTCGASLAAKSACGYAVVFNPTTKGTKYKGTFSLSDGPTDPQSPHAVTLSGTGG